VTSSKPTIGVLALQGSFADHQFALEKLGAEVIQVRRRAELAAVNGLVIPGGESTAISKLLRVFELDDPLRERIASGLPVYGTCAGLILLADRVADRGSVSTLGGMDVLVRRNAFGRQTESFETDLVIDGIADDDHGGPMRAVFIRAPLIESVGPEVEVLTRLPKSGVVPSNLPLSSAVAGDPAMSDAGGPETHDVVVAARQGNLLATAFHPEVTDDLRLHEYFLEMCR
jgi:5'-phosphate synthase pdxT subunit